MSKLKFCGNGVTFQGKVTVIRPSNVCIKSNVHIGGNAWIDGRGGVEIGDNTHISRNFVVLSSNHNYCGECLPYDNVYSLDKVKIGRNVWIGTNVIIVAGVCVGHGAIIAAGTVVSKAVPELAIVGSQPMRILKYRDSEHYQSLDGSRKYGGVGGFPLS